MFAYLNHLTLEDQKDRYQTTWLLPYLDVESLVEEPLLFVSLLHARTAFAPVDFTIFPDRGQAEPTRRRNG